jgi:hypothetical protein
VLDKDGNVIFSYDDYLAAQDDMMPFFIAAEAGLIGFMLLIIGIACLHEYLRQRRLPQTQALEDFVSGLKKDRQSENHKKW